MGCVNNCHSHVVFTLNRLRCAALPRPGVVVVFFFWNPGKPHGSYLEDGIPGLGYVVRLIYKVWGFCLWQALQLWDHIRHIESHPTWRIIPVSKWLVTPIYKPWSSAICKGSHNPILRGQQRSPWLLTTYKSWDDPPSSPIN